MGQSKVRSDGLYRELTGREDQYVTSEMSGRMVSTRKEYLTSGAIREGHCQQEHEGSLPKEIDSV